MELEKSKPLSILVFIPLSLLIFFRPFFSGLAYPVLERYFESLIIFFAITTFAIEAKKRFSLFPKTFEYFPALAILAAYLIATAHSINTQNSIAETAKFMSFASMFFMVSLMDSAQKKIIIRGIIAAALLISAYSIYQYLWGYQHTIDFLKKTNSDILLSSSYARDILIEKRVIGTFPSPNILAGYLIMTVFLCMQSSGPARVPARTLLSLIIIIFALLLTKSLGAWLSLISALVVLVILSYNSIKKHKALLVLSILAIAAAIGFIVTIRWERLIHLDNPQNSITQRLNYWRTAIAVIKDHPLLGVGPGNFQEVFLKYKIGLSTNTRYAHNIFLHTWAETGLLGFIALIFLIANFIIKAKSKSRYILIAGLTFLFHNLIDNTYFIPEAGFLWWVLLAAL